MGVSYIEDGIPTKLTKPRLKKGFFPINKELILALNDLPFDSRFWIDKGDIRIDILYRNQIVARFGNEKNYFTNLGEIVFSEIPRKAMTKNEYKNYLIEKIKWQIDFNVSWPKVLIDQKSNEIKQLKTTLNTAKVTRNTALRLLSK